MHGQLQSFDLEAEVSRLRAEKEWQERRRNAFTLRKGGGLSVVLMVMKAGVWLFVISSCCESV